MTDSQPHPFCLETQFELARLKTNFGNLQIVVQRLVDVVQALTAERRKP